MIVSVSGFGWSGSGAVLDLLREYSDLEVAFDGYQVDPEFILLAEVDGIRDLEYHLVERPCRISSYLAIQRFLELVSSYNKYMLVDKVFGDKLVKITEDYISVLIDFKLEGATYHEYYQTKPFFLFYNKYMPLFLGNRISRFFLGKDRYKDFYYEKTTEMLVSYKPDNFLQATKDYLGTLFSMFRHNDKLPLIFDQMLPPDNPTIFMRYFDDARCIAVRRDPRDTYLLAKCTYNSKIPIPTKDIDSFIAFYRKIIQNSKIDDNPMVLNVQFEDLLYKYDETKTCIQKFLGISEHTRPKSFFKPEASIQNTQLFRRYRGFEEDIRKIEQALPESLYHFENYPEPIISEAQVY